MAATRCVLLLAFLVFFLPVSAAYGTLDATGNFMPVAREPADAQLKYFVYGFYSLPATAGHHYKVGWEDGNRSVFLYHDADSDYHADSGETRTPGFTLQAHGNATDHVLVMLPDGFRAQVCPTRAPEGVDGAARGLRCGGDLDRDGDGDVEEILQLRIPVKSGPNDGARSYLPVLP